MGYDLILQSPLLLILLYILFNLLPQPAIAIFKVVFTIATIFKLALYFELVCLLIEADCYLILQKQVTDLILTFNQQSYVFNVQN